MGIVECEGKTPRQINMAIKALIAAGETDIRVRHPAAHHNLGCRPDCAGACHVRG